MIVLSSKDMRKREFPTMTRDELEGQWAEALQSFEQARTQKTEIDRVYLAAATELNRLERLMNKAKKREVPGRR